ncbi:MAG: phosphoglycerate dehydrogenase [Treponema sp.]|jgi:D-3-phosphoglycerate dehydrogenase|nr:phosphoglycerate dehydrogenase [Treponema sp.]
MKILVTATSFGPDSKSPAMEKLRSFADALIFNPHGRPLSEDELISLLPGCAGCVAGLDFFSKKTLENAPELAVISRYGAGVDRVDLAAARAGGVAVCNTPGVNAQAVAELTMALLLCVARKIPFLDRSTREGQWPRSTGMELYGKTIGILGLGAVGKAVAQRAKGFSMRLLAYDPYIDTAYTRANGITAAGFDEAVREADFLCLHLPLTEETRHIISGKVIGSMKQGAVLINTARGGLIDEAAAYESLKSGHLGGMGLDVYEAEPPQTSPLFTLENVVLTPHTASHTKEATAAMAALSVQNLIEVLSGKSCIYRVC